MKSYEELTRLGKIRRLRLIAFKALEAYDLDVEQVKFLTIETNTMFQVRSKGGKRFVLRIYTDGETTLKENQAEMFWLAALKRDTDLRITEPVARRNGEYLTIVSATGVPGERRCALFKWVPGRTLADHICPENYFKFGQTLARLHDHAYRLKPLPSHIQPKKWDKVFYYPDEPVVYNTPQYSRLFPPERLALVEEVIEHADRVFARLFAEQDGQILIHGELNYWNIHYHRGELHVIDFEDINLGYPVQDIAISLSYGRARDDYDQLRAAFEGGYGSIRGWPSEDERTIQTLMAARSVMFINYAARIASSPEAYIEARCQELVRFLEFYG